jgi:hypothetical protein
MSYARHLARAIDTDLVERIEAGTLQKKRETAKTERSPRPGGSYRGARRNEARNARKTSATGKRVPMITYADILRINAMVKMNRQRAQSQGK